MASNSDNQTKTSSLQDKMVGQLKKLTARDDINALRSEIAALRAEFEKLPNGPREESKPFKNSVTASRFVSAKS